MEIRQEVKTFAEAMESKLALNDKEKSDSWKRMSYHELRILLEKGITKLPNHLGDVGEYVDVANFCMFLWWRQIGFGAKPLEREDKVEKLEVNEIMIKLYGAYGSDTGVLFGIPRIYNRELHTVVKLAIEEWINKREIINDGGNEWTN